MRVTESVPPSPPVVLTIAGSDSSAGAGIQADLKTLSALGVFAATVVTAVTAQNSLEVTSVHEVPAAVVGRQLDAVLADMPVRVIKTGMLGGVETMRLLAEKLPRLPLVLDPVMVASSGRRLMPEAGIDCLREHLLPRTTLLTPNLPEAAALLNTPIASCPQQMRSQAASLLRFGSAAVLLKGGHLSPDSPAGGPSLAVDVLATAEGVEIYQSPRIETDNTRGTGCTLASAVAAFLARGRALPAAVAAAKAYIGGAIAAADDLRVARARGPLHHFFGYEPWAVAE